MQWAPSWYFLKMSNYSFNFYDDNNIKQIAVTISTVLMLMLGSTMTSGYKFGYIVCLFDFEKQL